MWVPPSLPPPPNPPTPLAHLLTMPPTPAPPPPPPPCRPAGLGVQGKLELRSWKDEEKLQRERGRKRGRAGGEEDGEEDEGAMFDFQRPSKFKVATRQLTGKEVQERQQRQEALEPAS